MARRKPLTRKRPHLEALEARSLLNVDFQWARSIGPTADVQISQVMLDTSGDSYITGSFQGTADFDPETTSTSLTSTGTRDAFVAKYTRLGGLLWARSLPGSAGSTAQGVNMALDPSGNIMLTGSFSGTVDFDPGTRVLSHASAGSNDIFVEKLSSQGNCAWARWIGGTGSDVPTGLALDASGNVDVVGSFTGKVDFDPGSRVSNLTSAGSSDAFILQLNSSGNYAWAGRVGGTGTDAAAGLAVDSSGNVYVTGKFQGTVDLDPGAGVCKAISNGLNDIFVEKLSVTGTMSWAKSFGGVDADSASGIALDALGNVVVVGTVTGSVDFDPGPAVAKFIGSGSTDAFAIKLDTSGNYLWADRFGGTGAETASAVAIDAAGAIYVAGRFQGTVDFDPGAGVARSTSAGSYDAYVTKLDGSGTFVWNRAAGGAGADQASSLAVDTDGNVTLVGSFTTPASFGPSTLAGRTGDFLARIDDVLGGLRVSADSRYLVNTDGTPFFYLADTAWALFQNLNQAEDLTYLQDREAKQFDVVHATILASSPTTSSQYGQTALLRTNPNLAYDPVTNPFDPTKPNPAFFDQVDFVVDEARQHGLYVALMPTWGTNVGGTYSIFNTSNAFSYGQYLGQRYGDSHVIWLLGGDVSAAGNEAIWSAMAKGIESGSQNTGLISYHPSAGSSSTDWFAGASWLSFDMIQSGHSRNRPEPTSEYQLVANDYALTPTMPVIDGESGYENIPEGLYNVRGGGTRTPYDTVPQDQKLNDYDVRTKAYWSTFSGAFGYVYGANGVTQFTKAGITGSWIWDPGMTWDQAINLPGATEMGYLRSLIESRPKNLRMPDESMIVSDPGLKYDRIVSMRASDGSYAMVYSTSGKRFTVDMTKLSGTTVNAWWFNPRTGEATLAGQYSASGTQEFIPPTSGPGIDPPPPNDLNDPNTAVEGQDWVLVLDDASKGYAAP